MRTMLWESYNQNFTSQQYVCYLELILIVDLLFHPHYQRSFDNKYKFSNSCYVSLIRVHELELNNSYIDSLIFNKFLSKHACINPLILVNYVLLGYAWTQ